MLQLSVPSLQGIDFILQYFYCRENSAEIGFIPVNHVLHVLIVVVKGFDIVFGGNQLHRAGPGLVIPCPRATIKLVLELYDLFKKL